MLLVLAILKLLVALVALCVVIKLIRDKKPVWVISIIAAAMVLSLAAGIVFFKKYCNERPLSGTISELISDLEKNPRKIHPKYACKRVKFYRILPLAGEKLTGEEQNSNQIYTEISLEGPSFSVGSTGSHLYLIYQPYALGEKELTVNLPPNEAYTSKEMPICVKNDHNTILFLFFIEENPEGSSEYSLEKKSS